MAENEIMIIDEQTLKEKMRIIRGQPVLLDFDLAKFYGYTVSAFNQAVTRNMERFPDDFVFELTSVEMTELSKSQNVISIQTTGVKGGRTKPVKAFTEQGVYMLMTVLRSPLAIEQSKTLIRLFKGMKDYIAENHYYIEGDVYRYLIGKINDTNKEIDNMKVNMLTKADLPEFLRLFDQSAQNEEILILDGQPFKADVAYQKIYSTAKKSIIIVDDYIGVKTLHHLVHAKENVKLTIISDNRNRILKLSEYHDFLTEYPTKVIEFIQSRNRAHDRYIVLDNDTSGMKVYHCGASSKDAGKRITTITRLMETDNYKQTINEMLTNPPLVLK